MAAAAKKTRTDDTARSSGASKKPYRVTMIPGDGIGPEVTDAAKKVIEAADIEIEWEEATAGECALKTHGTTLPDETLESIKKNGIALKGPITTPVGEGFVSVNVGLRKALDLYCNMRPVRSAFGTSIHPRPINLVIFRENTEDLYAGLEQEVAPGVTQSLKIITEKASTRIARSAFEYSRLRNRKTVHAVHKANIMKRTDGLFLDCCRKVAKEYPEIEYKEIIVDNCAMQMVMRPEQFDVMVLGNLYGDIISDLAAGLIGGLGVVPGANIGETVAVYESVHGSAPDIAGKGVANPLATILSSTMMLRKLGEGHAADRIQAAVILFLADKNDLTPDLGGNATTDMLVSAIIGKLGLLQ